MYDLAGDAATVFGICFALFGGAAWWCWKASQKNRDTEYNDTLSRIYEQTWDSLYPRIIESIGPELCGRLAEPLRHSPRIKSVLERLTVGSRQQVTLKLQDVFEDLIETVKVELQRTALADLGEPPPVEAAYKALQDSVFPVVADAFALRTRLRRAQWCLRRAACAFLLPIPPTAYISGALVIPPWRAHILTAAIVAGVALLLAVALAFLSLLDLLRFSDIRQRWMIDHGN